MEIATRTPGDEVHNALRVWAQVYPGLASLLDVWRRGDPAPFPYVRLATAMDGELRMLVRVLDVGPEVELGRIADVPMGYRMFCNGPAPGSRAALRVVPSEQAVLAAVLALRDVVSSTGIPAIAPLPLAPLIGLPIPKGGVPGIAISFGEQIQQAMMSAADAATASGALRLAPAAYDTDLEHEGCPVFDVRLASSALTAVVFSSGLAGIPGISPMIVRENTVGGSPFWLLMDGRATGDGLLSCFASQAWNGASGGMRETWQASGVDWRPAPPHLLRPQTRH